MDGRVFAWGKASVHGELGGAGAAAVLLYAIPQMIGGSWLLVLLAVGCGAVWTAMRIGTRSLWAPWLCHLGWDLLVFIVHPLETP